MSLISRAARPYDIKYEVWSDEVDRWMDEAVENILSGYRVAQGNQPESPLHELLVKNEWYSIVPHWLSSSVWRCEYQVFYLRGMRSLSDSLAKSRR
jgi:hypothetical protein